MHRRLFALLVIAGVAGCVLPDGGDADAPESVEVGPPEVEAGGFAACASSQAQLLAFPMRAEPLADAGSFGPGISRESDRAFVWVWATYHDTQRQDRVSRLNEVQLFRETDGAHALCTRVEIVAPTTADGERRTYDVAARFVATDGPFPDTWMRVVVNWAAGCACDPLPLGNTTATFAPFTPPSQATA